MISKWNLLLKQRVENKDNIINEQALMEQKKQEKETEKKAEQKIEKFTGPLSHSQLVKSIEQPGDEIDSDQEVYFDRPATQ